tara:strand:+ start:135 stop:677 length:543 start_codon:yes stop_codon:yes gene_type:complete
MYFKKMYKYPNIGKDAPGKVNVLIEISMHSSPVKYEFDEEVGMLRVDRFLSTSMQYPANYGFIPHTLSGDGDPLDALVYTRYPIAINTLILAKPVGVLKTEDEKGEDEKILLVPVDNVDKYFEECNEHTDLGSTALNTIEHFFRRYKDLEEGKWVKITGWGNSVSARKTILDSMERYRSR